MLRRLLAFLTSTRGITQAERGEQVTLPGWNGQLIGCCDCGLMHRYDFSVNEQGQLVMRARRDHIATEAIRRDRVFPFAARTAA